jgi:hypothetical protein
MVKMSAKHVWASRSANFSCSWCGPPFHHWFPQWKDVFVFKVFGILHLTKSLKSSCDLVFAESEKSWRFAEQMRSGQTSQKRFLFNRNGCAKGFWPLCKTTTRQLDLDCYFQMRLSPPVSTCWVSVWVVKSAEFKQTKASLWTRRKSDRMFQDVLCGWDAISIWTYVYTYCFVWR